MVGVSLKHYEIENGIPIPKEDLLVKKSRLYGRSVELSNIKKGITIKIKSKDVHKEKSRYTAVMSKHKKKFRWKFSTKIHKNYLEITRLK